MQDGVDQLESVVDLISDLGTSEDNLAANKDQEHDLGLDHAVDKTREQLRLIRAEVVVTRSETLQTDGELDVARSDNVLDLEVGELGVEAYFDPVSNRLPLFATPAVTPYRASG